jgi:acyl dehydratase
MDKIYWDDIAKGDIFWVETVVVDPEEMLVFARRNDPQPFHLDKEAAKDSIFGTLIANGGYKVALWYRSLIPFLGRLALLAGNEWHITLPAPVRPNDRLRCRIEVKSKRLSSKPGRGYALV